MQPTWREAFRDRRFTRRFVFATIGLIAFGSVLPYYFINILLPKPGVTLADPILNSFTPQDWSIPIFLLIYAGVILFIGANFFRPLTVLLALQTYVVSNFMRLVSLYLFTLEAPEGIIPLRDPFLTVFAYGQEVYVKDLFFSGHVVTLAGLLFSDERNWMRLTLTGITVLVALLLAWQRVHYSIDMIAAAVVAFVTVKIFRWANKDLILHFQR